MIKRAVGNGRKGGRSRLPFFVRTFLGTVPFLLSLVETAKE